MTDSEQRAGVHWHLIIFLLLATGLGVGGFVLLRGRTEQVVRLHRERMEATAGMLADRLANWRDERLADAVVLSLASDLSEPLEDGWAPEQAELDELQEGLDRVRRLYNYEAVALLDGDGRALIEAPPGADFRLDPSELRGASPSLVEDRGGGGGHVRVIAVARITRRGEPVGFVALRVQFEQAVADLRGLWPARSQTAEAAVLSRQGGPIVALTAPRLSRPAGQGGSHHAGLLAAAAPTLRDGRGFFEARDDRGQAVLAVAARVPGSPWFVLLKIDREEALASDRAGVMLTTFLLGALVALSGLGTHLVWLTQRRAAERQLASSRRRHDLLFRNALSGIAIHEIVRDEANRSIDYVFLDVNPAFERLTGLSRHDILGRRVTEVLPGIEAGPFVEAYGKVVLSGEARRFEAYAAPLGRHYEVAAFSLGDALFGTIFEDITFRHETEAELRDKERYLRALFEGALDPILVADDEGRWVDANPAAAGAFGLTRAEILGRSSADFAAEDDADPARAWREFLAAGQMTGTYRARLAGGLVRTFEFAATARVAPGRHLSVLRDVTERLRAEEALEESERLFRLVLETIPVGVWLLDRTGHITYANPAARRIWGGARFVGPEDFGVFVAWRLPGREPVAANDWAARRALKGGVATFAEALEIQAFDGVRRQILASALPIRDETDMVVGVLVTNEDVTEQRRLEHHVQQAQKMEAVGRLAGGVAHDFNNILAIIAGRAEALRRLLADPHDGRRHLEEIADATERATALTRQLLAFGRKQVLQRRPVSLNVVVDRIQPMLARLLGEDVQLRTVLEDGLGAVLADAHQVEQILLNLAVNARDAMPDGGTLTITTSTVVVGDTVTRWSQEGPGPGRHACLEVADTGGGMDAETRLHVFEPFFTTKGTGQGTGLGLSTVYGIVSQNEGHISVDSEPGRGTTFRVHLPITDLEVGEETAGAAAPPPRGTETVLVVEDERSLRDLIREDLEELGYTVHAAASPAEALGLAATHGHRLDLVLTDVILPQMNGRELVARLSADHPAIAAVYMSGYTADVIARHGVLEPGVYFLQKPFPARELARRIREALDSGASARAT